MKEAQSKHVSEGNFQTVEFVTSVVTNESPIKNRSKIARRAGVMLSSAAALAVVLGAVRAVPTGEPVPVKAQDTGGALITRVSTPTPSSASAGAGEGSTAALDFESRFTSNAQTLITEEGSEFKPSEIKEGTSIEVVPGDVISGDDSMSDKLTKLVKERKVLYDTDENRRADITDTAKTALVIVVDKPGFVYADNGNHGATLYRGLTAEQQKEFVRLEVLKNNRKLNLDGTFGRETNVIHWVGQEKTITQKDVPAPVKPEIELITPENDEVLRGLLDGTDPVLKELLELDPSTLTIDQKFQLEILKIGLTDLKINYVNEQNLAKIAECACTDCMEKAAEQPLACPESDKKLPKGSFYVLPAGSRAIVQADATIDGELVGELNEDGTLKSGSKVVGGIRTYDDLGNTGSVSRLLDGKSHTIYLPVGPGDIQVFCPTTDVKLINDKWYKDDLKALYNTTGKDKNGKTVKRTLDPKSITIN